MIASSVTPPAEDLGWRSHRLDPWPLQSKLGLAPLNKRHADGTHDGEVRRLGIRNKRMTNDPRDSRRENQLITSHHISIDIYERENEVRRKVYSKVLYEG